MPKKDRFADLRGPEDPVNIVHEAVLRDGVLERYSQTELRRDAVSSAKFERKQATDEPAPTRRPAAKDKIHPLLAARMRRRGKSRIERVVITYRDDFEIPRFPEPDLDQPRDCCDNERALERADALVKEIEAERERGYAPLERRLAGLEAVVEERFWLIKALEVQMPLGAIGRLVADEEVLYVEPVETDDAPPQDDVVDGRASIVSDPYFNLGLTSGWIGLLDTGLRRTHVVFNSPSHIDFMRDCVNGGANCNTGTSLNPNDDCWDHGTSSAAIITANARQGNAFRGVTGITLDSFKVYPAGCGGLSATAAVNGFQRAVNVLDRVIVAEMQAGGTETSSISAAADSAYDAGAVVIAANGNNGPNASTVNVPAVAQKVLGIGAIDVKTLATPSYQSRGPAGDGRVKPDVQAPTNVETASNAGTTATQVFGGTSAATPEAAGAAALLRNFLRGTNTEFPPGNVYSHMIMSGTIAYPFNSTTGAGRLKLPVGGNYQYGSTSVTNGQTVEIPLTIAASGYQFNAAIWWPEVPATHNDVDLSLVDPSGTVRASSPSASGVFERVSVNGPLAAGTWKLRIRGYSVTGSQQVFWSSTQTTA